MRKNKTLDFRFSQKHMDYIRRCKTATINVAEGAVRAGKTVDNVFAFADELECAPDTFHLASGSTSGNAKLNIGVANGYGLEGIFRGRCKWTKYKGNDALRVKTPAGVKYVIFAGGGKADSFRKIRGNSFGLWIATEINLHHEDFVREAFNRQLAAGRRKVYWDLNPEHPRAPIYVKYLDVYDKQAETGAFPRAGYYNYEHFTIFDNQTVTEERLKEILAEYTEDSIWYTRDILGKRCIAEGLVYKQFAAMAATPTNCMQITTEAAVSRVNQFIEINIGIDFGGNDSAHAFVATAVTAEYKQLIGLASMRVTDEIDPDSLTEAFVGFSEAIIKRYGYVSNVYCDSAEPVLIRGLKKAAGKAGLYLNIKEAWKERINDRIFAFTKLVTAGRFLYTSECATLVDALCMAIWRPNTIELERLDNGTSDIDTLDAFEYSFERRMKRFENQESG